MKSMESSLRSRITATMHQRTERDVDALISESRAWLYRLALAIVASSDAAEDAVQETLLRASKSRGKLRDVDDPKAWLRQVLVRRAITQLQSRKHVPLLEAEEVGSDQAEVVAVRATLNRLQPVERAMLALWHFEGLSYEEMARMLDIPVGTVGSRLSAAREAFRKEWAK